eukprot:CAMPEP_0170170810 /NCGR_PEP_ID=MMETSP0040_2-20121228/3852_1 /TAXON_ID=641309 /ORGANISM="Lotharella oceanica, Strain CCMP622" /LENGTH=202 /DNA_ID=CAMNT_0010410463 /DNA_START=242 /DNA_END=851 /DNA_ORIENTATION=+
MAFDNNFIGFIVSFLDAFCRLDVVQRDLLSYLPFAVLENPPICNHHSLAKANATAAAAVAVAGSVSAALGRHPCHVRYVHHQDLPRNTPSLVLEFTRDPDFFEPGLLRHYHPRGLALAEKALQRRQERVRRVLTLQFDVNHDVSPKSIPLLPLFTFEGSAPPPPAFAAASLDCSARSKSAAASAASSTKPFAALASVSWAIQ